MEKQGRRALKILLETRPDIHERVNPIGMAGATGLEPAASCVTGRRSNQLNYAPAYNVV